MSLKLKCSYATEIYITDDRYVALKQPGELGEEDDLVLLIPDQLPHIIKELQRLYDARESWDSPTEDTDEDADEDMDDPSSEAAFHKIHNLRQ